MRKHYLTCFECAGVIEETTDEKRLPVGTQVISIMGEMGRDFDGGYAEYALLPNQQIHPVHTDLPIEEWAALPETYFTAYGSMRNLNIREQDRVLVRGATSGVGIAFLRLLKGKWTLDDFDPLVDMPVDAYLTSFHSGNVTAEVLQGMLDYVEKYGVNAAPEKVFSLEEVPDAHRYLESGSSFGKVVVVLEQNV